MPAWKISANLTAALVLLGVGFSAAQSPIDADDQTRDAFIRTRPAAPKQTRPVNARHRPANPAPPTPLGLGYTLYAKNRQGQPERVDPGQVFSTGDEIRFVVEANQDAYLYIFNADSKGALRMIYPHARLQNGDNFVRGHVPYQIPSAKEPDPEAQWFAFLTPGEVRERIVFVLSRSPLPDVPTHERLIQAVRQSGREVWTPPDGVWSRVALALEQPVKRTLLRQEFGRPQAREEALAITREIGLRPSAAAPSVIQMSESPEVQVLAAGVELVKR